MKTISPPKMNRPPKPHIRCKGVQHLVGETYNLSDERHEEVRCHILDNLLASGPVLAELEKKWIPFHRRCDEARALILQYDALLPR